MFSRFTSKSQSIPLKESKGSSPHSMRGFLSRSGEAHLPPPSPILSSRGQTAPQNKTHLAQNDCSKLGSTFRQLLDHPTLGKRFRAYAASHHSDEGICCLDQLAESISNPSGVPLEVLCNDLLMMFFQEDAKQWVNLPSEIHTRLFSKHKNHEYTSVSDLFEEAMYEVFSDLKHSDMFRDFFHSDPDAIAFSNDSDTLLLDLWIVPENFSVASACVGNDSTLLNLVRFCCSVVEYERAGDRARKLLGNKIISTYVENGSRHQVQFPVLYAEAMKKGEFKLVLSDARIECLQVLSLEAGLMVEARKALVRNRTQSQH